MSRSAWERFQDLPEADRALLRERAKSVARREEQGRTGEHLEILEMEAGGQTLAVPLNAAEGVAEVTSIAPVPRPAPAVKGLLSFRGEILLAADLGALVASGARGLADLRRFVVVTDGTRRAALLVERIIGAREAVLSDFVKAEDSTRPFVRGTDRQLVSLLDPPRLLDRVLAADGRST